MGKKGDQETSASAASAGILREKLSPLGDIRLKKMFGGHGVFYEEKMFALVDSQGAVFFKADDSNKQKFESVGAEKHGRMPYYQIPQEVFDVTEDLHEWAQSAIDAALNTKK